MKVVCRQGERCEEKSCEMNRIIGLNPLAGNVKRITLGGTFGNRRGSWLLVYLYRYNGGEERRVPWRENRLYYISKKKEEEEAEDEEEKEEKEEEEEEEQEQEEKEKKEDEEEEDEEEEQEDKVLKALRNCGYRNCEDRYAPLKLRLRMLARGSTLTATSWEEIAGNGPGDTNFLERLRISFRRSVETEISNLLI
uniref:Uncharacterized protein n=1 Tax=Vespula pensylvanica TaxID=30213 RepID=A0A834NYK1_VESPE|nr:hypothetical protein H0235_009478 [Vespula pensylvanica]